MARSHRHAHQRIVMGHNGRRYREKPRCDYSHRAPGFFGELKLFSSFAENYRLVATLGAWNSARVAGELRYVREMRSCHVRWSSSHHDHAKPANTAVADKT